MQRPKDHGSCLVGRCLCYALSHKVLIVLVMLLHIGKNHILDEESVDQVQKLLAVLLQILVDIEDLGLEADVLLLVLDGQELSCFPRKLWEIVTQRDVLLENSSLHPLANGCLNGLIDYFQSQVSVLDQNLLQPDKVIQGLLEQCVAIRCMHLYPMDDKVASILLRAHLGLPIELAQTNHVQELGHWPWTIIILEESKLLDHDVEPTVAENGNHQVSRRVL